jgi:hypothetical protein
MAFGVEREGKKRNGGGKDYPGHPETAHIHETYDVIQDCSQLSGYLHPRPQWKSTEAKMVAAEEPVRSPTRLS